MKGRPGRAVGSGPGEACERAEHLPGIGKRAVAVLGGGPHDELAGVVDHPGSHADQLSAQPLAVRMSVRPGVGPR